jgi:hypothetical protein
MDLNTAKSAGRRRLATLTASAAVTAVIGGTAVTVPAATAATASAVTTGHVAAHEAPAQASITFQASNLGDHDEFVVTFPGTAPALSHTDSDQAPIWAGSGKPVSMPGHHFIYLTGSGTDYPLTGPNPVTYSLPNLESAVLYDDSEGSIGIALGLDHAAAYTVTTQGDQVTVDISH